MMNTKNKKIIEENQNNGIRVLIDNNHITVTTLYDIYNEENGRLDIYEEFRKQFDLTKKNIENYSKSKTIWGLFESSFYPNIIENEAIEKFKEKAPYYTLYVIGVCWGNKKEGDVCSGILQLTGTENILTDGDFRQLLDDLSFMGDYFLYSKKYTTTLLKTHSGTLKSGHKL